MKLLLLGAGESGKSTFLKQMRIIHGVKFEPDLLKEYQQIIYQNVIKGLQVLVDAREKLDIQWEDPAATPGYASQVMTLSTAEKIAPDQFNQYCPAISLVWRDGAIRKAYDRRREFQIVKQIYGFLSKFNFSFFIFCRATQSVISWTIYTE